jgi:hypothetical protein
MKGINILVSLLLLFQFQFSAAQQAMQKKVKETLNLYQPLVAFRSRSMEYLPQWLLLLHAYIRAPVRLMEG